jgi:hypothetical protein
MVILLAAAIAVAPKAPAQNMVMPAAEPASGDNGAAPMSSSGDVSFFSQDLGTILRLRYSTESYGQEEGNFDVGSMQVITFDDSAIIADGQVTMNDKDGVGFNVGTTYRWLDTPMYSPEGRVEGLGIFADGQHTEAGNFFPQIGLSMESLGELWDLRGNLYVPVGPRTQTGDFKPTNTIGFLANSLSELSQATVDTSFTVGELEIARRLGDDRDAWAFAGPYFVANSDDSAAGYKVGVRGYAYPDLLLQFAVSNDDIFHTEATFSLQWFVGRTRTNFQPAGNVEDRIREPVIRNDYVALNRSTAIGGTPLTNTDGTALRFVHVASSAAAGGNGTAEHPYNELDQADGAGSQTGDIILAHSKSTFTTPIILQDNQKLFGEGNNFNLTVATLQRGTISIPETSPGAKSATRPLINIPSSTDAVTLANNNEIVNFDMNGQNNAGTRAIAAPAAGAGNPNIHDLAIMNTTGDAIMFKPTSFVDTTDSNGNGSTTDIIVPGNVTINNLTLTNIGGSGVHIDSTSPVDISLPNTTLQETIALSNITSTSTGGTATGVGINLENTHSGHATTLSNYTYNGGTTSAGGLSLNNFNGTFDGSNSTLTGGASTGNGVQILGATDSTNITFESTWAMNGIAGTDVNIDGGGADSLGGTITFANAINNTAGRSISVQGTTTGANISFNGNITDSGTGILVNSNAGGEIAFVGAVTSNITTPNSTAILLTDNTGTNIDFAGATGPVKITATGNVDGFVATGGGTISAGSTTNSISTETGQDLKITGMTIAAGGFNVGTVNRTGTGAITNAIQLENNTGSGTPAGAIVIGNTTDTAAGDSGTIKGGTLDAITIKDSANVSITGLKIDNTGNSTIAGIHVEKTTTAAMTTDLSTLETDGGAVGIDTFGPGTGAVTMTINDTAINGAAIAGARFTNLAAGTVTGTGVTIDGQHASPGAEGVQINGSNATITFDSTSAIKNNLDNDFEVNGGAGAIAFNGTIQNSAALNAGDTSGHSVNIHGVTGGSVNVGGTTGTITDANQGILITGNSGGTIAVAGTANTLNTGANDAVTISNNTGGNVSVGPLAITTTSGNGIVNTGNSAGTYSTGTATITTTTGSGIVNANNTGGTFNAGQSTITTTTGTGIATANNSAGTFTSGPATITTTSGAGFDAETNTGATITTGPINITTASGPGFVAKSGGTLNVTGLSNTISRTAGGTTGQALDIENMAIGAVDFQSVNATGGVNGTRLVNNTGGTITVGVNGNAAGAGGTVTGTTAAGVHVENSNVEFNGVTVTNAGVGGLTDSAVEVLHTNSTAMNANLNTLNVTNTTTAGQNGVLINGFGGSGTFTANVQNMNVNANGNGFTAENGVTLTATGTNTITSNTGVGLNLDTISVGAAGANFQSVNVTNGGTNGIVMKNVSGPGTVTIGANGGATGSGGSLTTTGDAIVLLNTQSAALQHIHILSAGGQGVNLDHDTTTTNAMAVRFTDLDLDAATGTGFDVLSTNNTSALNLQLLSSNLAKNVNMSVTGSGAFNMITDSTTVTSTGNDVAFALTFAGTSQIGNATFTGTNNFTAANGSALNVSASGGTAKTIGLNVQNGNFNNSSTTNAAAVFSSQGTTTLNATIQGNTFDNAAAGGQDFAMTANGTQARILLNLGGDVSTEFNTAAGQGDYELHQTGGSTFRIFESADTLANLRNNGTVNQNGGTYTDSVTAPPTPVPPTVP